MQKVIYAVLASYLLMSCGGGGSKGGGSQITPPATLDVKQVVDQNGGTVESPNNETKITIPAGAMSRR